MVMEAKSEIAEFYAGQTVLVTGCTGFVGKVLIWKLLHSCPLIERIYILLRPKNGKTVANRRNEFLKCPIFNSLKSENLDLFAKVVAVQGDVAEEKLGLSESDEQMFVNDVSIVFYGAALLKMDATLKQAINVNTKGVIRCLDIASNMKKLNAFVYVSTAYCCSEESYVEEKIYNMNANSRTIMKTLEWLSQSVVDKVTEDFIAPLPNTYTFSKRITELCLADYEKKLPVIIARPTIVVAGNKEPMPGWIDSLNGVLGLSSAVGKGVIHSIYIHADKKVDMVPVDIVCNTLIAIPWAEEKMSRSLTDSPIIYNVALVDHEQLSWRQYIEIGTLAIKKYPFKIILWYPTFNFNKSNLILHKFETLVYHWMPAYFIDAILFLLSQKTFMVRMQRKVSHGMRLLSYFTTREWTFQTDSVSRLNEMMNEADRSLFPVTEEHVDAELLAENALLIAREQIFNENFQTPQQYRGRLKLFLGIKVTVKLAMYYLLLNFFVVIFRTFYNYF